MSAEVQAEAFGWAPFLAWCDECQEGVRHKSAGKSQDWADKHNRERHS